MPEDQSTRINLPDSLLAGQLRSWCGSTASPDTKVAGTRLQRIVNTPALIIRDEAGMHYLEWVTSGSRHGSLILVAGFRYCLMSRHRLGQVVVLTELIPQVHPASGLHAGHHRSTTPADSWSPTATPSSSRSNGTPSSTSNTAAAVFREPTDREIYAHVADLMVPGMDHQWHGNTSRRPVAGGPGLRPHHAHGHAHPGSVFRPEARWSPPRCCRSGRHITSAGVQ